MAVWDLETGTPLHQLTGHQGWVNSVAVSPDGRRIVSGSLTRPWRSGTSRPATSPPARRASSLGEFRGGEPRRATIVSGSLTRPWWSGTSKPATPDSPAHRASSLGEFRGSEPRRATHRLGVRGSDRGGLGPRNRDAIHRLTGHQAAVNSVAVSARRPTHRLGVRRQHRGDLGPRNRHADPPAHGTSRFGELRGGEPRRAPHRLGVR